MVEGCAINGNPKPELKEMTGAFVVKFIRRTASEGEGGRISGGVNEGINRLLEFIRKNPGKRIVEIAAALNIPSKTIERWLKKLREQEKIVFIGSRKTGGYFIMRATPNV
jgi:ATP-dependent DNA helicase RecG